MVLSRFQAAASSVVLALMAGCSAQSSIKPAEFLDERTGMTVGALGKPIELFHSPQRMATSGERISFAYLAGFGNGLLSTATNSTQATEVDVVSGSIVYQLQAGWWSDRKSTRLNSSHLGI